MEGTDPDGLPVDERERVADLLRGSDPLFRVLIERSMDVIAVSRVTADSVELLYVSPAIEAILGYDPRLMVDMDMESLVDSPLFAELLAASVLAPGETSPPIEFPVLDVHGERKWLEVRTTNLQDHPVVRGMVSNARDITTRKRAVEELERTRALAESVLRTAHDAYVQVDRSGRITEWNRRAEDAYGYRRDEVLGRPLDELILASRHRAPFRRELARVAELPVEEGTSMAQSVEYTAMRRDGTEFPVEVTAWATFAPDGLRFNGFIRDITDRKALEERLSHEALHDELTGLPNRNLLLDALQGALNRAERSGLCVAVMFCDLDQFKVINDGLGHTIGDELLQSVARRLRESTRLGDTVGRFGGDEFVIVFDGVDNEVEATDLAERVLSVFRQPFRLAEYELFVTASIGVAVATSGADGESLLRDADAAMYRAKEKGRARLEVFDAKLRRRAEERHVLHQALRRALERDEFRLVYQPVVSLLGGEVVGGEALLRWERPGHGLVPPAEFMALVEETGLIVPIGVWVLDTACHQLRAWNDAVPGRDLTMAINVSARQLSSPTLVADVSRAIEEAGCRPGDVTLELTETVLMEDADTSLPTLAELKAATGVRVAIDDFGTGYSSLAYLRQFPVDKLKIDKSFIDNVGADPYDSAIIAAIATMGRMLDHEIVAEGVETLTQAQLVKDLHCQFAQGYYFARPLAPEAFLDLLRAGTRFDLGVDLTGT